MVKKGDIIRASDIENKVPKAVISTTEPTTGLIDGLTWYNPTTDETKIYLNGAFRSVGGGKVYNSTTQPTGTIKEGEIWYNPSNSTTQFYLNGAFRKINAANADTATKLQTARTISLTGDATGSTSFDGSANASISVTLANSGVTAGTYAKVTVDAKGRVTAGTTLSASDIPDLDGSKIKTGTLNLNTNSNQRLVLPVGADKWA